MTAPDGRCFLTNGMELRRTVRKEIRMLTNDELQRLNNAIRQLKLSAIYDQLANIHRQVTILPKVSLSFFHQNFCLIFESVHLSSN